MVGVITKLTDYVAMDLLLLMHTNRTLTECCWVMNISSVDSVLRNFISATPVFDILGGIVIGV